MALITWRRIGVSRWSFVEYEWGGYTSLVVFLAMYFITLWVAWRIAVWLTTPKAISDSTGAGVA
jgi:hypothetical protein